jgi:hypothetical protein
MFLMNFIIEPDLITRRYRGSEITCRETTESQKCQSVFNQLESNLNLTNKTNLGNLLFQSPLQSLRSNATNRGFRSQREGGK